MPLLIRSIIQSESIDRLGHLFGIIGTATFSAAQNLTDALEEYTNILFVGEPNRFKGKRLGRLAKDRPAPTAASRFVLRFTTGSNPKVSVADQD
jgi:hypothetical protein